MVTETAEAAVNIAALVTGTSGFLKIGEEAAENLEKVKSTVEYASSVVTYANRIQRAANAQGSMMTMEEAHGKAVATMNAALSVVGEGDDPVSKAKGAMEIVAKADPTGILGAVAAFMYPVCSVIHADGTE